MKKALMILLMIAPVSLYANSFSFLKYRTGQGLSQNTVWCILQDSYGFMWFGTQDGLNRYDGNTFKVFQTDSDNGKSIGSNFVLSGFEDKQKRLWFGTDNGVYIYDPETEGFTLLELVGTDKKHIPSNVYSMITDNNENVWISSFGEGLYKYNRITGTYSLYTYSENDPKSIPSPLVWSLHKDRDGKIWGGSLGNGLFYYHEETDSFVSFNPKSSMCTDHIYCLYDDPENNLWIGTWNNGLRCLDRETNEVTTYFKPGNPDGISHIRCFFEYSSDEILIGSDNGLFLFNRQTKKCTQIDNLEKPTGLSQQAVISIGRDRENSIWIGTYYGGVNYVSNNMKIIEHYYPYPSTQHTVSGKVITQFCEGKDGNLWIGTADGGLSRFNPDTKQFLPISGKLSYYNIQTVMVDGDKLWIGYFAQGIDVMDIRTGKVRNYTSTPENKLTNNDVYMIYKNKYGLIYVGTIHGLNVYDEKSDGFIPIPEIGSETYVYDIIEDDLDYLWIASYGNGIIRYNYQTKEWTHFMCDETDTSSLSSNKVTKLFIDRKKRLWIATEGGGLCQYNYAREHFSRFTEKDGLPGNVIHSVVDDKAGNLWISTNKGLASIHADTWKVRLLTENDGLQSNQFNYKSVFKDKNGKLYFGGINGFNSFYPEDIVENTVVPPVVITKLQVLNQEVPIEKGGILEKSVSLAHSITLTHKQSTVAFDFVALSFINPQRNQYAYCMKGVDDDWVHIGNQKQVTYANLSPGSYEFQVKASNDNGLWNEEYTSMKIKILPPFYLSVYAYVFYVLLFMLLSYFVWKRMKMYQKEREQRMIRKFQIEKEKETYVSKINFFTNIAHEIRTPLTLIKAPLENIIISNDGTPDTKANIRVIEKNTERLLTLINQLLDFRKIEENLFPIKNQRNNLTDVVNKLYDRFIPTCKQKNINLKLQLEETDIYTLIDGEALTKIISNLLTNAVKYARRSILLSLDTDGESFHVIVTDDGIGIPKTKQEKIFDAFYQINENTQGTGIGLSLVKSLTTRLNGTIEIKSIPGSYTSFELTFPLAESTEEDEKEYVGPVETEKQAIESKKFSVLIVEDNEELRTFLLQNLDREYQVYTALSGLDALDKLNNEFIDIVVSDIIMPEMDGMELCRSIKSNPEYSHIPIIILSAKTTVESKIQGLQYGADVYMDKPFSIRHLSAQINSLLVNRNWIKEKFINSPLAPSDIIASTQEDSLFIRKLNKLIMDHLSDSEYSVDDLASSMCVSRSSLHKKIKGISGIAPNEYVQLIRLKKAAELLQSKKYKINEICYIVGFNTPSYFAKCFYRQFHILPKDFGKEEKE